MADPTTDAGLLPRTYFRAPRVPFDFRAVTIAVLGFLVYWGGAYALAKAFDPVSPVSAFFDRFLDVIADIPFIGAQAVAFFRFVFMAPPSIVPTTFWHALIGGTWVFLVWAFFGQAIHRIISLRIARDEGLSLKEALGFAAKNFATIALCPLIVAAAIALFYGCNAIAGVVISIPYVGQILSLILVPLALISTLIIILIAIGGVLGMPLVAAAAAWERNGSLDAISRAFSYVFARPLQFFWNYLLIFLFTGFILLVGAYFDTVLVKSIDAGVVFSDESSRVIHGATHFDTVKNASFAHVVTAFVFWLVRNLIGITVMAYAIYWFLGASTSTYADLRADVDGTEEDEIYLEEEEEDFEALAKAETPPPPAGPPPASPPVPGAATAPPPSPYDPTKPGA